MVSSSNFCQGLFFFRFFWWHVFFSRGIPFAHGIQSFFSVSLFFCIWTYRVYSTMTSSTTTPAVSLLWQCFAVSIYQFWRVCLWFVSLSSLSSRLCSHWVAIGSLPARRTPGSAIATCIFTCTCACGGPCNRSYCSNCTLACPDVKNVWYFSCAFSPPA